MSEIAAQQQFMDGLAKGFPESPTVLALSGLIPVENAIFQVTHHDRVLRLIQECGLFAHGIFREFGLRHIPHDSQDANTTALSVRNHHAAVSKPTIMIQAMTQPILNVKGLAVADRRFDATLDRVPILGMNQPQPFVAGAVQVLGLETQDVLGVAAPDHFAGGAINIVNSQTH